MTTHAKYNWYAIYTASRNEKKVFDRLEKEGISAFLPLIKKQRQWSDRKKWVEMPLFSSYLFVKITPAEYQKVLRVPGVVKYISFESKAVSIPEKQIETIKAMLLSGYELESTNEKFESGDKIRISAGPLIGLEGVFINYRGTRKVMIRIEQIGQSILLNVPVGMLTKL